MPQPLPCGHVGNPQVEQPKKKPGGKTAGRRQRPPRWPGQRRAKRIAKLRQTTCSDDEGSLEEDERPAKSTASSRGLPPSLCKPTAGKRCIAISEARSSPSARANIAMRQPCWDDGSSEDADDEEEPASLNSTDLYEIEAASSSVRPSDSAASAVQPAPAARVLPAGRYLYTYEELPRQSYELTTSPADSGYQPTTPGTESQDQDPGAGPEEAPETNFVQGRVELSLSEDYSSDNSPGIHLMQRALAELRATRTEDPEALDRQPDRLLADQVAGSTPGQPIGTPGGLYEYCDYDGGTTGRCSSACSYCGTWGQCALHACHGCISGGLHLCEARARGHFPNEEQRALLNRPGQCWVPPSNWAYMSVQHRLDHYLTIGLPWRLAFAITIGWPSGTDTPYVHTAHLHTIHPCPAATSMHIPLLQAAAPGLQPTGTA